MRRRNDRNERRSGYSCAFIKFLDLLDGPSEFKGLLQFRLPVNIADIPISSGENVAKVFPFQM